MWSADPFLADPADETKAAVPDVQWQRCKLTPVPICSDIPDATADTHLLARAC